MNGEKIKSDKLNLNLNEEVDTNKNINGEDSQKIIRKGGKKISKKSKKEQVKIVPLLKPPSKRRKFDKDGKTVLSDEENNQEGIKWDNKSIEEQRLDSILHPRTKIDEPKTPYPDGDENDIYQDGINKVNEIKPTEELLNDVVASLNEKNKSKTEEFKKKAYSNEYTKALEFYAQNKEKFDDLSGERKICLQNTLINKFHKEVRKLSKEISENKHEGQ